jgi:hypothetical protein
MNAIVNGVKCANCEAVSEAAAFCPHCGQKHAVPGDLGLGKAWRHVVDEVLNLDGRIFHTLKLLYTRPGQLTLDFLEGRRARHVHPLRLFLVFSALYFLIAGPEFALSIAQQRLLVNDATAVSARAQIVAAGQLAFKVAFIGSMLINGVALWLFFRRQRAYLAEHMVAALHIACVAMTLTIAEGVVGRLVAGASSPGFAAMLLAPYAMFAFKRTYADTPMWKAVVSAVTLYLIDLLLVTAATVSAVHYAANALR